MDKIKGAKYGAKYDDGKPRPSLVPVEAIEAIMQVREFDKAKCADAEDWRKVPREEWLDALLRHVLHIWDNPLALDDESGLPALWHVITNAAFLCAAYKDDIDKFYAYAKELNEAAGEQWDKMVQSALNNPIAKDIHVDWVWTGPGPDPRGEEGTPGCMGKSDWDITKCLHEVIKQIELERVIRDNPKEAAQCGDANGRGNG